VNRPQKLAVLYLGLVFLAGAIVGVAGYRFYAVNIAEANLRPSQLTPQEYRKHIVSKLQGELKLNAKQTAEVQEIYDYIGDRWIDVRDAMEPEFEAMRKERAERIMAILNPEQQEKYRAILAEKLRQREAAKAAGTCY
jgi:hypothetical protein